ncbi:hypothetical protein KZZ20_10345 [Methylacidiphilum fumariolicum]|uniref:Transposase n=1 Tax=Candidatus Methylacidiphilum fumarolicum TaxID=591154 RepID=A0ABN8XB06_9BACT|nr:hypothetical protein [Candidatus Methylacidiphilum fumarolicum]MBW6415901.1 hypothetical protein [Candidatus Methylacidiphilum fumarolicum]CAI9084453.1 protein of unknown function [Candidatus Methylacidiphilum fumarolicum]
MSCADTVGAYNLKKRIGDLEIGLWTPRNRLYAILLVRFTYNSGLRRIGKSMRRTVPGRTTPARAGRYPL